MRFLFIGPGYPGVSGASSGSGIGTYLREITRGLTELGHECHVIVWKDEGGNVAEKAEGGDLKPEGALSESDLQVSGLIPHPFVQGADGLCQQVDGVRVFLLAHAYWPLLERVMPDSRDVWNLRRLVRRLDAEHCYDWIEVQSEEGIGIGVQRDFPARVLLRVHTTLLHMVETKGDSGQWTVDCGQWAEGGGQGTEGGRGDGQKVAKDAKGARSYLRDLCELLFHAGSMLWKTRYRLWRERRSFLLARRIVTHSRVHAEEIKRRFSGIAEPAVVHHGIGAKGDRQTIEGDAVRRRSSVSTPPVFLLIGTLDRRKGFDRLRPVLEAYVSAHGPCRVEIVAQGTDAQRAEFGLEDLPRNVELIWLSNLDDWALRQRYAGASVFLHLARYESFGLPLIEAAACGVPVVSTSVGIAPELLSGALYRYIVDGDNAAAVADALVAAAVDRAAMGAALKGRYEGGFTRAAMASAFLRVIRGS